MANKIQLRRGLKANLPTLDIGEPAFCTDTKEFFIGTASGNAKMSYDASEGVIATDSDKLGGQLPSYYAKESDLSSYKAKSLTKTTADITYYVATTGSDSNNGTSSSTPFKTIAKAISMIPQVVNHHVTINVGDGIYNESIELRGFVGTGNINITGNTTTPANVSITYALVEHCTNKVYISGYTATSHLDSSDGKTYNGSFCAGFSTYVDFQHCQTTFTANTASYSGFSFMCMVVGSCMYNTISNKYYGIHAEGGGFIQLTVNTGSGNTYGAFANSGSSICNFSNGIPTATTATKTSYGGTIV